MAIVPPAVRIRTRRTGAVLRSVAVSISDESTAAAPRRGHSVPLRRANAVLH
jgi:hypothetical protein